MENINQIKLEDLDKSDLITIIMSMEEKLEDMRRMKEQSDRSLDLYIKKIMEREDLLEDTMKLVGKLNDIIFSEDKVKMAVKLAVETRDKTIQNLQKQISCFLTSEEEN